jgi:hypothetical protein
MIKMLIIDGSNAETMEFKVISELKRFIRKKNRERKANKNDRLQYIYRQV